MELLPAEEQRKPVFPAAISLPSRLGGRESWAKREHLLLGLRKAEQGTLCPAFPPGSKPAGICPRRKAPEPAQTGLPPPEASTSAMRAFRPPGAALPCTPKRVISDKRRLSSHRTGGGKSAMQLSAGRRSLQLREGAPPCRLQLPVTARGPWPPGAAAASLSLPPRGLPSASSPSHRIKACPSGLVLP